MRYHALIPAAGNGTRFSPESPKQYWLLDGKPVLQYAIARLAAAFPLHRTYVALAIDDCWFDRVVGIQPNVTTLRCGGDSRAQTVRNALHALSEVAHDDWILVHDAVRPCIDAASLLRLKEELADDSIGGLLAVPLAGTLKRADHGDRSIGTEPREGLWRAQTPQMFRYRLLSDALAAATDAAAITDDASAVEALGHAPMLVEGHPRNLKVTLPQDIRIAEMYLAAP